MTDGSIEKVRQEILEAVLYSRGRAGLYDMVDAVKDAETALAFIGGDTTPVLLTGRCQSLPGLSFKTGDIVMDGDHNRYMLMAV